MWPHIIWILVSAIWTTLCEMAPYLLFGFLVAGLLSAFVDPEIVERHLGGRGIWPVVKASLLGVPLPLCSCGVIPVAASLRRHGASRGATASFLLSTPQTGVDSIVVTYSLMGGVFAILRPVAAFITGLVGGWLVDALAEQDQSVAPSTPCMGACCVPVAAPSNKVIRALHYGFVILPRDIGRALMVGLIISGVIAAFVPDDFFAGLFGTKVVGMLVMMAVGIPLYVCATGSVPVAAALMMKGVSPGAALVFLMTGPATNAASLAIIWKVLGKKTALIYLLSLAVCALAFGLLLDYTIHVAGPAVHDHHGSHALGGGFIHTASGVALLAILAWAYLRPVHVSVAKAVAGSLRQAGPVEEAPPASPPQIMDLQVLGMNCASCVESVGQALGECPGVWSADVDLKTGNARITGAALDDQTMIAAVEALGYKARVRQGGNSSQAAGEKTGTQASVNRISE